MNERNFTVFINNSFKAAGAFSHKIPDMPNLGGEMRFQRRKPLDGITFCKSTAFGWEAKYSRGISGFNFNILKDHQKESLETIEQNGFPGYLLYCCYKEHEYKIIFIFTYSFIKNKQAINKKELMQFMEKGKCLFVKTKKYNLNGKNRADSIFDFNLFHSAVIGETNDNSDNSSANGIVEIPEQSNAADRQI